MTYFVVCDLLFVALIKRVNSSLSAVIEISAEYAPSLFIILIVVQCIPSFKGIEYYGCNDSRNSQFDSIQNSLPLIHSPIWFAHLIALVAHTEFTGASHYGAA